MITCLNCGNSILACICPKIPVIYTEQVKEPAKKDPHRCPVCGGNGQVGQGFYSMPHMGGGWSSAGTTGEKCRSCDGTGVVWG